MTTTSTDLDPQVATRILAAADAIREAKAELRAAVADARTRGYSWAAIGAVLRISRQAAWEQFGKGAR